MGLSIALDGIKKSSVGLDKSDALTASEALQSAGLPPYSDMRYLGHDESLEHGRVYTHCMIRATELTPSECNIEVTVPYPNPKKGQILMKMLYSSCAQMVADWELIL